MHCSHCYKDAQFKCGSCLESKYCSKICQKSDWVNHKIECIGAKRDREQECHNEKDLFTLDSLDENHYDMFLGDVKYCFNFDPLVEWILASAMDENRNPRYEEFHLGDPNCIRLLINDYTMDSALWPKPVIGGLDFTTEVLRDLANQYDNYLFIYPEKRYQRYIIVIGLIDYDDILYTENVKLENNIEDSYNTVIENILKETRKNGIPNVWIEYIDVNYRLIETNDKHKNMYSVAVKKDLLEKSLKIWSKKEPFVIRLNFKLQKLPNLVVTTLLPDVQVQKIVFNPMIFIYFIKKMFDPESKDFPDLIATNIFEKISNRYIGEYKLSVLFDYDVKIPTKEFLKTKLNPYSNLKNLESWKFIMNLVVIELRKYYIELGSRAPLSWQSMANQKEWELLIRINSQSI